MNKDKRYYFIGRFQKLLDLIGDHYCDQNLIKNRSIQVILSIDIDREIGTKV